MLRTFTVVTRERKKLEEQQEYEKITGKRSDEQLEVILKNIQIEVGDIVEAVETQYDTFVLGEAIEKDGTLIVLQSGKTILLAETFDEISNIRLEDEQHQVDKRAEYLAALAKN